MRESEFWMRVSDVFGEDHGRTVTATQHLSALGDRTPDAAIAAGLEPGEVWEILCDHMGVPESRRFGNDRPLRRGRIEE